MESLNLKESLPGPQTTTQRNVIDEMINVLREKINVIGNVHPSRFYIGRGLAKKDKDYLLRLGFDKVLPMNQQNTVTRIVRRNVFDTQFEKINTEALNDLSILALRVGIASLDVSGLDTPYKTKYVREKCVKTTRKHRSIHFKDVKLSHSPYWNKQQYIYEGKRNDVNKVVKILMENFALQEITKGNWNTKLLKYSDLLQKEELDIDKAFEAFTYIPFTSISNRESFGAELTDTRYHNTCKYGLYEQEQNINSDKLDDIWEAHLAKSYRENHWYPEHWSGLMPMESTIHCLCNLWACALRKVTTAREALEVAMSWVRDEEGKVREKFRNLHPIGVIIFFSQIMRKGFADGKITTIMRGTEWRKTPLDAEEILKDYMNYDSNSKDKIKMDSKYVPYITECRQSVTATHALMKSFGLKLNHGNEKFECHNIIASVAKWGNTHKGTKDEVAFTDLVEPLYDILRTLSSKKEIMGNLITKVSIDYDIIIGPLKNAIMSLAPMIDTITATARSVRGMIPDFTQSMYDLSMQDIGLGDVIAVAILLNVIIMADSEIVRVGAIIMLLGKLGILPLIIKKAKDIYDYVRENFWDIKVPEVPQQQQEQDPGEGTSGTSEAKFTADGDGFGIFDIFSSLSATNLAAIIGVIGFTFFSVKFGREKCKISGETFAQTFRNIYFMGSGVLMMPKMLEAFGQMFQWIKETAARCMGNKDYQTKEEITDRIIKFIARVNAYSTDITISQAVVSDEVLLDIEHLVQEGFELQKLCVTGAVPHNLRGMIQSNMVIIRKLGLQLSKYRLESQPRTIPYHIQFYGIPGIGKSQMMDAAATILLKGSQIPFQEGHMAYARNAGDEFWAQYNGEPVVYFDDMFQDSQSKDMVELINMVSNVPYRLPMADVQEKGYLFTSKLIISSTNTPYPANGTVRVATAIYRRRHLMVEVQCPPEYITEGVFDFKKYKRAYPEDRNRAKYPGITFTLMDPLKSGYLERDSQGIPKRYNYVEFLKICADRFKTFYEAEFAKINNRKTYIEDIIKQIEEMRVADEIQLNGGAEKILFWNPTPSTNQIEVLKYFATLTTEQRTSFINQCNVSNRALIQIYDKITTNKHQTTAEEDEEIELFKVNLATEGDADIWLHENEARALKRGHEVYSVETFIEEARFLHTAITGVILNREDFIKFFYNYDELSGAQLILHDQYMRWRKNAELAYNKGMISVDTYITTCIWLGSTDAIEDEDMIQKIHELYIASSLDIDHIKNIMKSVPAYDNFLQRITNAAKRMKKDVMYSIENRHFFVDWIDSEVHSSPIDCKLNILDKKSKFDNLRKNAKITVGGGISNELEKRYKAFASGINNDAQEFVKKVVREHLWPLYVENEEGIVKIAADIPIPYETYLEKAKKEDFKATDFFVPDAADEVLNRPTIIDAPEIKKRISYNFLNCLVKEGVVVCNYPELPASERWTFDIDKYISQKNFIWRTQIKIVRSVNPHSANMIPVHYEQFIRDLEVWQQFYTEKERTHIYNTYIHNIKPNLGFCSTLKTKIDGLKNLFIRLGHWFSDIFKYVWDNILGKMAVMLAAGGALLFAIRQLCSYFIKPCNHTSTSQTFFRGSGSRNHAFTSSNDFDQISAVMAKNIITIKYDGNKCNAFGMNGQKIIAPAHIFKISQNYRKPGTYCEIMYTANSSVQSEFTKIYIDWDDVIEIPDKDILILHSNKLRMFQKMDVNVFLPSRKTDLRCGDSYCHMYYKNGIFNRAFSRARAIKRDHIRTVDGFQFRDDRILILEGEAIPGSSGGPVFTYQEGDNHMLMVGFQSSIHNNCSYVSILTREEWDRALSQIKSLQIDHLGPCFEPERTIGTKEEIAEAELMFDKNVHVMGILRKEHIVSTAGKTDFMKTPIHEYFPSNHEPAVLSTRDKRIKGVHFLRHSVNKFTRDIIHDYDPDEVKIAVESIACDVKYRTNYEKPKVIYDIKQIVTGLRKPGHTPLNLNTSPGLPRVIEKFPGKLPGKKSYININELGHCDYIDPIVLEEFEEFDKMIQKGIIPPNTNYIFPKDELRPIEKLDRTRSIETQNLVLTLLFRKYFGDGVALLNKNANGLWPYCVGINPDGPEFSNIYHRACRIGMKGGDLDVKNWDGHMPPWLMYAVSDIFDIMYGDEFKIARRTIMAACLFAFSQFGKWLIWSMRGMKSGFPGTAPVNTMGHWVLFYLIIRRILYEAGHHDKLTLTAVMKIIFFWLYGDDMGYVVHPDFEHIINNETIAEMYERFGWPATAAAKLKDISKLVPIDDIQFLKRKFVKDDILPYVYNAAIDKATIINLLHWQRHGQDDRAQFYENLIQAFEFACDHGFDYYESLRAEVNQGLASRRMRMFDISYVQMRSILHYRRYNLGDIESIIKLRNMLDVHRNGLVFEAYCAHCNTMYDWNQYHMCEQRIAAKTSTFGFGKETISENKACMHTDVMDPDGINNGMIFSLSAVSRKPAIKWLNDSYSFARLN